MCASRGDRNDSPLALRMSRGDPHDPKTARLGIGLENRANQCYCVRFRWRRRTVAAESGRSGQDQSRKQSSRYSLHGHRSYAPGGGGHHPQGSAGIPITSTAAAIRASRVDHRTAASSPNLGLAAGSPPWTRVWRSYAECAGNSQVEGGSSHALRARAGPEGAFLAPCGVPLGRRLAPAARRCCTRRCTLQQLVLDVGDERCSRLALFGRCKSDVELRACAGALAPPRRAAPHP
jgi:hypothetical protein